jgi:hypothetical protein
MLNILMNHLAKEPVKLFVNKAEVLINHLEESPSVKAGS